MNLEEQSPIIRLNQQAWDLRFSERSKSTELAKQALDQATNEDQTVQRGYALRTLGFIRRSESNPTEALKLLNEAHEIATEHGELSLERDSLNLLASVYAMFGNFQLALEHTQTALEINKKLADVGGQVSNLINICSIFHSLERHAEAESVGLEAVELAWAIGDMRRIAEAKSNIGTAQVKLGRYREAVTTYRQALATAIELNLTDLITRTQVNLAEALTYLDEYKEALSLLRNAERIFLENDVFEGMAYCRLNLGALYLRQQHSRLALEPLESGLWLCQTHGMKELEAQFLRAISEAQEQQQDYAAALKSHKRFYEVERELRRIETERQLNAISAQRELDRARAEAELERMRRVELGQLVGQLEWQAVSDPLTELYNRRHLETHLQKSFLEAQLENKPLSVAMLDVDNFKGVNDTFGHTIGDDVLKIVAKLVKDSLRAGDIAARYGGEEFALVIHAQLEAATKACERLRTRVEFYDWAQVAPNLKITVTIGVSSDTTLENHEKMLDAADKNLFLGKRGGKNQVKA